MIFRWSSNIIKEITRITTNVNNDIYRGEYSLVNMAGEPQRVVELFPTGKSQEPRVTLLQVV